METRYEHPLLKRTKRMLKGNPAKKKTIYRKTKLVKEFVQNPFEFKRVREWFYGDLWIKKLGMVIVFLFLLACSFIGLIPGLLPIGIFASFFVLLWSSVQLSGLSDKIIFFEQAKLLVESKASKREINQKMKSLRFRGFEFEGILMRLAIKLSFVLVLLLFLPFLVYAIFLDGDIVKLIGGFLPDLGFVFTNFLEANLGFSYGWLSTGAVVPVNYWFVFVLLFLVLFLLIMADFLQFIFENQG